MSQLKTSTPCRPALERLIAAGDVQARFQPIVDLQRSAIAGFEALSVPSPGHGFDDVTSLFDSAHHNGLLWDLERLTRGMAIAGADGWPAGTLLFLNCTPDVFANPDFAATVLREVREVPGLNPGRIVLELTEKSDNQHVEGLEDQVARVKAEGFQVAIDDVGAGASGLNRIMALRPHWLKLDRELVQAIDSDHVRQNLIRFLIHFAKLSGVRLIAEGIETQQELATLVDMGVAFGQGYYLGKPAGRDQTLAEPVARWLRERWTRAESIRFHDPRHARIARFMRPVVKTDARRTVGEIAAELMRDLSVPGVAVIDGERCAGWCDRDTVLRAAGTIRVAQPIGFLIGADTPPATAQTTIAEALELAASREERSAGQPLLVEEAGEVVGLIAIRDLLHAAAETSRELHLRTAPLTGLPGRVRAEQHIRALIAAAKDPGQAAVPREAALIDIRNLGHYNGVYGYDLGDQLLKRLVAMLQAEIVADDDQLFLAHLGDDRFLITAPRNRLEPRLRQVIRHFDASLMAVSSEEAGPARSLTESEQERLESLAASFVRRPGGVSLRVVLLQDPFSTLASPRDLYRMGDTLRSRMDSPATPATAPECLLVFDSSQFSNARRTA
ncbi:MAG: EAL domain-containing protein [Phycisphaerales bacterium]|nr:EAL domain-containing protein [Phycisphaerales bacterium]